jgi:hypothetical protein
MSFRIQGKAQIHNPDLDPKALNVGKKLEFGSQYYNVWLSVTKMQKKQRIQPTFFFTMKFCNQVISIGTRDVILFYEQMRITMSFLETHKDQIIKKLAKEQHDYENWKREKYENNVVSHNFTQNKNSNNQEKLDI